MTHLFSGSLAAPLLATLLVSGAVPAAARRVTSVEGVTEYQLPNGLRVLLFPDPTEQTITVNMTYLVGSRHEGYGETGMAHLLEHLVFKGTDKHPNIPQELTAHGARPNGSTSFDRTNYFETFQASDENLTWALELEADRMVGSHIWKKDLDTEMTVVRNEFESGENSPIGVLLKRVMAVMFDWHNYGHVTIGARSDIESVPIERLQAFYRRFYQPDNVVMTIAGRFDEAKTLAQVVQIFSPLPRPERKLIPTYTAEPTQDGERTVTLRRVGDVQVLLVGYHAPAGTHADAPAMEVLGYVLGNEPAGRLHKALVEAQKASAAFGFYYSLDEPGAFLLGAEVRQEQSLDEANKLVFETVDALQKQPITAEEVERARTFLLKNIQLTMNQAERVGLVMSEFIAKGDWRLFFLRRDRLRKVTAADVRRVAALYLKVSNRTVGEFIPTKSPERAEIPPAPEVAALLAGYIGDKPMEQGEAFDPSPANIESRTARPTAGGVKLALLPKKTRGGKVVASMTLHYLSLPALQGKAMVESLTIDMLRRGSRKYTRQQLQDELDKLKARLSIGGGGGELHASIETVKENLPQTLALLAEMLRAPVFPPDQFAQLVQERLSDIEQDRTDPGAMAETGYARHLNPYPKGDPRATMTPEESIEACKSATLEQLKAFHAQALGASHAELAVVGAFDGKQIAALAQELFADWKSPQAYERVPRPYLEVAPESTALEAPDKANAVFLAGQNLKLRDDDADYPALELANYMLGGGFLNSRLAVRIRQKEGLSYGVSSRLSVSALDDRGSFLVTAIHAPQNTRKLEAAMREELKRALADGFTAQELKEARSGWLQARQLARAQDGDTASHLAQWLYLGRTLQWDADYENKVAALTAQQIVLAMRRHIDPARFTVVRAGEFKKDGGPVGK